jgi:hypothetical protein
MCGEARPVLTTSDPIKAVGQPEERRAPAMQLDAYMHLRLLDEELARTVRQQALEREAKRRSDEATAEVARFVVDPRDVPTTPAGTLAMPVSRMQIGA